MSVFAVPVLQPKSWWDSPLAGGGRSTSQFSTSTLKSGRCSQQLLQGKAFKLSGQLFLPILFYRWRKKISYTLKSGKSQVEQKTKQKMQLLKEKFVSKDVSDPEIKKNKNPFFLLTEKLRESP